MEQEEPPGGAVSLKPKTLTLNSNVVKEKGPAQRPDPPEVQTTGSEAPNPVQDQTLVLAKPEGPPQSPAQSIVVRVPAMALLQALAQSTGQTQVRIPLTRGPGPVLVPSVAPGHIHLTASVQSLNQIQVQSLTQRPVQSLTQIPAKIQFQSLTQSPVQTNQVRSSGIIASPTRSSGAGPGLALVRPPGPVTNLAPSPGLNQNQVSFPSRAQVQTSVPIQVQDPDLVQIPLPPEAVRPFSPPPITSPLKPSAPPLGFRLNGRLIPLLPGMEDLEVCVRSHPRGSKSSLTSLHLKQAPPHSSSSAPVSGEVSGESAPVTPPPAQVTSHMPRPPTEPSKPRSHVASLKPRPQRPKGATLLQKEAIPAPPPDCARCKSPFRPVPELRGFICMCSSEISKSLQNLSWRRKEERLKSKLKKLNLLKHRQKVSKPQPFHSSAASKSLSLQKPLRAPGHFLSEPRPSAGTFPPVRSWPRPSAGPSPSDRSSSTGVSVGGAVGRLVIRLEDFYYGSSEGHVGAQSRFIMAYRCVQCNQKVHNNIRLMQHMIDHMTDGTDFSCRFCFRQIIPLQSLQRHLEAVHGAHSCSSTVVCQICECEFETEIALLLHMRSTHKPGEMPYACEVCGFRSSFFTRTWRHFEEVHADTKQFLCHFCLRVLKAERPYQLHVARHQRKQIYSCDKCRLHFLTHKDRQDHQDFLHGTHVRPPQLSGLRPGTKVTVRTFQVSDSVTQKKLGPALAPPRVQRRACKRQAVESLGTLLAQVHSSDSSRCVECLSRFQDYQTHFPSIVKCSRCRFQTCCSRAYANHMINNHSSANGKRPRFPSVFTYCPSWGGALECLTCGFSSDSGDAMALHLSSLPKHICLLTEREEELQCTEEEEEEEEEEFGSRGGFVPIEQMQNSSHLSIKVRNTPTHLSSPVAMTITMRGPGPCRKEPPLSVSRIMVLLDALLLGFASASQRFGLSQALICRWAREQKKGLANRRWRWDTADGARWVLTEREQNRVVKLDAILDLCQRILGPKSPLHTRLNWAVDFLLRHDLGLETRSKELRDIGYSVVISTLNKVSSLALPPARFCCMDEFPVFLDSQALSSLSPDGLRVWGERDERPLVEVMLCGASDGSFLRPLLFYDKALPPLPQGFPENIVLRARDGGFGLRERAEIWGAEVWFPHLGFSSTPSLLLLDEHNGHMTEDFLQPLQPTELVHIPQGCGFVVQPLDQCVAPVVRQFLKVRWVQLVSQASCFSESDLVLTLSCWFSEVCHILNENKSFVHRSFLCVGTRFKTAEVSHQKLNQDLHRVLLQTTPPRPQTLPPRPHATPLRLQATPTRTQTGQSEVLNEPEEAGLHIESQSEQDETEECQLKPQEETEGAGLRTVG